MGLSKEDDWIGALDVSAASSLKTGSRVLVPWGLDDPREAVVVEVWGDPNAPSHIRVRLVAFEPDEEAAVLLLNPDMVTAAA